jgi:hypothetical protein
MRQKVNRIWICQREEGWLEGNSWGESYQSSWQQGQTGAKKESLNAWERIVTNASSELKKKSHLAKQTGSHS